MREITQKIVGFSVKTQQASDQASEQGLSSQTSASGENPSIGGGPEKSPEKSMTVMNETIARPEILVGSTYKISKSPSSEHALYVTINDIILDEETQFERRRPFEIFINSKNMDQFQWIVAMTRILSAVFRKGGDVTFIVEEMKAVFDPHGGYFRKGGYVPSLIAEIGGIVETHLKKLGIIESGMDEATQALIAEKKNALSQKSSTPKANPQQATSEQDNNVSNYPANATMCPKCFQKATIIMDGCATCLNCGASKCG